MDSLISEKLDKTLSQKRCTLLGIGPMSKNCVDATIELVNHYDIPLMLIASRRQIEAASFGGGYVNNWSTEEFSKYVKERDKNNNIILSRDHGGPWQNESEKINNLSLEKTMESAKTSFQTDIESGFGIIHIDATEDIFKEISVDEILERTFELYEFCWLTAKKNSKEIIFEISSGKEDGGNHTLQEIDYVISKLTEFCQKKNYHKPYFLVIRTGNYVMEMRNVGNFETLFQEQKIQDNSSELSKIIKKCEDNHIRIKEHNTDYLSDTALEIHPKIGIHASNVAPEFGVIETKSFLRLLEENKLTKEAEFFLEMSYSSKKWSKWMLPNTNATKRDKAIIAGHYIFSKPEFLQLKQDVAKKLTLNNNLDEILKQDIKKAVIRYLKSFNLI